MTQLYSKEQVLASGPVFARLKELVIKETGLSYYQQKDSDLAERLTRRLETLKLSTVDAYLELLLTPAAGRTELELLIEELTIGETYFFRHQEQFDVLKNVILPGLATSRQASRCLRIWSAGCSIGAEAYSVSLLLRQDFKHALDGWMFDILGTDINRAFLAQASAGTYHAWALRAMTEGKRAECFEAATEPNRTWTLRPEYKLGVRFQFHNLVTADLPSVAEGLANLDVILCRNVMIYFDQATITRLLTRFTQCLAPGGWLLIGSSEISTQAIPGLKLHQFPGASAYQRVTETVSPLAPLPSKTKTAVLQSDKTVKNTSPTRTIAPLKVATKVTASTVIDQVATDLQQLRDLTDRGEFKSAMTLSEKLIATDPLDPRRHFLQGMICIHLKQDAHGEAALRKAIYLDRKYAFAHYHLGLLLRRSGKTEKAEQYLNNARRILLELPADQPLDDAQGLRVRDLLKVLDTLGAA